MSQTKPNEPLQTPQEQAQPTVLYSNAANFTIGAFDTFLEFSLRSPDTPNPRPIVRVHMSIEHAWVMAKLIDRLFADYRQKGGKFTIPQQVLLELGLTDEYREDMGDLAK